MTDTETSDMQAIIVYLAKKYDARPLGKKALQKILYIFQQKFLSTNSYKFDFYNYGVFSRELAGDLDLLKSMGLLDIKYISDKHSYQITVGPEADSIINNPLVDEYQWKDRLDKFIANIFDLPAWKLEIISTAIYISVTENTDRDDIAGRISELKPKFTASEINSTLMEKEYLLVA